MFNQNESTQRLHQNVIQVFKENFPKEYREHTIDVSNITFKDPKGDYVEQNEAFMNESDLATLVKADITITKDGKAVLKSKGVTMASIPYATNRGTYILGGNENVFINQMVLRPGVYVNPKKHLSGRDFIRADIRAGKQRVQLVFNETKGELYLEGLGMEFGHNGKKVDLIPLLLLLGVQESEIQKAVGDAEAYGTLKSNSSNAGADKIFAALSETEFQGEAEAKEYIENYFKTYLTFDDKAKKVSKEMIGQEADFLNTSIVLATIAQMFKENKEPGATPDTDDLRFKQVYNSEDLIAKSVESGIKEWMKKVQERIRNNQVKPDKIKPLGYMQKEMRKLYSSNLMEGVDSGNPLDLHQKRHKITQLGPGGLSDRSLSEANRNLQDTAFGKIDPVETPQSGKLGATQHLAKDAEIRNGTIYSKFYAVKNGKVDRSKILDNIDPLDEFDEYIAFNTPHTVDKENGWKLKGNKIKVRHRGDFIDVEPSKVTLMDKTPSSHLGHATALVPFGGHNDGARMLMGSSMQRQALALENPDEPLVQSVSDEDTGKTMESEMADRSSFLLKAPVAGEVSAIAEDFIEITDPTGKKVQVEKLNYFSTGKQGGYINHKPTVAVGDKVEAGGLLADGWQSKNGKMALGKNTTVAYMPFEGYNFEDGVVVSESFSQKMSSEEMKTIEYEVVYEEGVLSQPESKKKLKELLVSQAVLSKLDANGIIKKGSEVTSGDIFVAIVKERKKAEASAAERLLSRTIVTTVKDLYVDKSKYVQGYQKGKIIDVKTVKKGDVLKVSIKMLSFKSMEIGDKLSGRHGNKGTITKILPDAEMPQTEEGKAVELIFSPLAVPSRKNLGQLLEVNAGLVAEKKGMKSYNVENFNRSEKDKLMSELESIGYADGKQTLINPKTGKPYENKVTVGPMYVMKLKHKVEGKISARSIDNNTVDRVTGMPKKKSGSIDGDRHSPQGVGGMEFWSLTSAGAVHNIHEMTTLKSDGAGVAEDKLARLRIYEAIRHGTKIPDPVTPQTLKVLQEQMYGAGLQITPLRGDKKVTMDEKFTSLMLQPISKEQLDDMAPEAIKGTKTIDSRTGEPDKDGLYSPTVFGEKGEKWGRIDLGRPVPNPVFLSDNTSSRPYESMLLSKGIKQKDILQFVEKGKYIVLDPKDSGLKKYQVVTPETIEDLVDLEDKELEYATGGEALHKLLEDVDMKKELSIAEEGLRTAKKAGERSQMHRHVRTLSAGLDNDFKPTDYMLPFVPVLPVKYREPVRTNNSDQVAEDGITLLYQSLMKKNVALEKAIENYEGREDLMDRKYRAEIEADRYQAVKHIMGVGPAFKDKKKNIEYEGILHRMASKQGFLRENMQKKLQDYSGRSVIVVDPELSMDETGIPEDMAAEIFAPKIERELQRDRYTPKEIQQHIRERGEPFRRALSRAVEDEVVILNRQPSLHRHSLQAFKPIIRWDSETSTNRAIGLNPIVTTGFNADFDGDTMAVHVPITDAARKEAKEKLMPSQNLLNPTNNSLIMELKHEMQLGIYYMTRDRMPMGMIKEYKGIKELHKAYEKGEVATYDSVKMNVPMKGAIISTAGKHLFNSALPPAYMDYENHVDMKKGDIEKLLFRIMDDSKYGHMGAVRVINELKNLGFKTSTNSGVSIGVKDFDAVASIDKNKLFEEAENAISIAPFLDKREEYDDAKAKYVQKKIEGIINGGLLGQDNSVEIMRASGARGNAGQISAMAAMVGTGKDVTSKAIRPVESSLLEGTTPNEFWDLSSDSRKGIYDRSVASEKPGELTRYVWLSNKQTVVTEKDCGDTQGITLNLQNASDAKALHGRILLDNVGLKGGGVIKASKTPLSRAQFEKIKNEAKSETVRVRSPLSCKSPKGVCQYCYGSTPGSIQNDLVPIGEPVGSIASQAIGEPSQQAIMKTFHTGAGQSNVGSTFESIDNILSLKKDIPNKAILAEAAGVVTEIQTDPVTGTVVKVDNKKYKVGKLQLADGLRVGTNVKMGESLTKEFDIATNAQLSVRDPRDVLKYQGVDATREFLTRQVDDAFMSGDINNIDRRHMEIVVSNMTNKATIDSGGSSRYIADQVAPLKTVQYLNDSNSRKIDVSLDYANRTNVVGSIAAETYHEGLGKSGKVIVSAGETITEAHWEQLRTRRKYIKVRKKKIEFTPELQNVRSDLPSDNWLERASRGHSRSIIGAGATTFAKDQLDNPLTRQMTGLKGNFADGFQDWASDMKERFGNLFV